MINISYKNKNIQILNPKSYETVFHLFIACLLFPPPKKNIQVWIALEYFYFIFLFMYKLERKRDSNSGTLSTIENTNTTKSIACWWTFVVQTYVTCITTENYDAMFFFLARKKEITRIFQPPPSWWTWQNWIHWKKEAKCMITLKIYSQWGFWSHL